MKKEVKYHAEFRNNRTGRDCAGCDGIRCLVRNRINPCGNTAGETTVILHPREGGNQEAPHKRYGRNHSHVHEAMRLLATYEYRPIRLAESAIPLSIIGFKQGDPLLVLVIGARKPVPSAARLHEDFKESVEYLCRMAAGMRYRIII